MRKALVAFFALALSLTLFVALILFRSWSKRVYPVDAMRYLAVLDTVLSALKASEVERHQNLYAVN